MKLKKPENKTVVDCIKTFAIIKANRHFDSISAHEKPTVILDRYAFCYFCINDNDISDDAEYLVINLTVADAESLSIRFRSQSFGFVTITEKTVKLAKWQKKTERSEEFSESVYAEYPINNAEYEQTPVQLLSDYGYNNAARQFCFCAEKANELYSNNSKVSEAYKNGFEKNLADSLDEHLTFMGRVSARTRIKII